MLHHIQLMSKSGPPYSGFVKNGFGKFSFCLKGFYHILFLSKSGTPYSAFVKKWSAIFLLLVRNMQFFFSKIFDHNQFYLVLMVRYIHFLLKMVLYIKFLLKKVPHIHFFLKMFSTVLTITYSTENG